MVGSDGSPVLLPANGQAYLEVQVGTSLFGCDFAATGDPSIRRRLQSVPFAQESDHSDTCETCTVAISGGGAQAWVNFDGPTGTIRGQQNVSSITHASLGNFVINFTTPMANANYAAQITTSWNGATNQAVYAMIVSQTTTGLTIFINNGTTAYGPFDPSIVSVVVFN